MKKRLWVAGMAIAMTLASAGTALADDSASASGNAAVTWDVAVGKGTPDGVSIDSMFPRVVYVHEGDAITFTNNATITPHTVTFLAGSTPLSPQDPKNLAPSAQSGVQWDGKSLLNSGMMEPGKSYTVTFTAAGAYPYYCILHPLMNGTVVVLPKGAAAPSAVEQAAAAKAQLDDLTEQANALKAAQPALTYTQNDDGTLTYQVSAGVGLQGFSVNKNFPETLMIAEGDTVEWGNRNHYEMHFVTFNKPDDLPFFLPGNVPNPAFYAPAGGSTFDGSGFVNSGLMTSGGNFKLTFTKAGTYAYECYLHSGDKMTGTVIVVPKDAAKVIVNDKPLAADGSAFIQNNRVYTAIVPFVQAIGGKVAWNEELGAVVIDVGGMHEQPTKMQDVTGAKVIVNGKQWLYGSDAPPMIIEGTSYAPLQDLVDLLGGTFTWDATAQSLNINCPLHEQHEQAMEAAEAMNHDGM